MKINYIDQELLEKAPIGTPIVLVVADVVLISGTLVEIISTKTMDDGAVILLTYPNDIIAGAKKNDTRALVRVSETDTAGAFRFLPHAHCVSPESIIFSNEPLKVGLLVSH